MHVLAAKGSRSGLLPRGRWATATGPSRTLSLCNAGAGDVSILISAMGPALSPTVPLSELAVGTRDTRTNTSGLQDTEVPREPPKT